MKIYFLLSLAGAAALIVAGIVCVLSPESIESMIKTEYKDIMDSLDEETSGEAWKKTKEILDAVVKHVDLVGYFAIGCAVVVALGFLLCCFLMGFINFLDVCLFPFIYFFIGSLDLCIPRINSHLYYWCNNYCYLCIFLF